MNPLDLPPVPSIWLTDYRDGPGYAKPVREASGGDAVPDALGRIDRAAARKAA